MLPRRKRKRKVSSSEEEEISSVDSSSMETSSEESSSEESEETTPPPPQKRRRKATGRQPPRKKKCQLQDNDFNCFLIHGLICEPKTIDPKLLAEDYFPAQSPRRKKRCVQNPFPASIYDLLSKPKPSLDKCIIVTRPHEFIQRNLKQKKPDWYCKFVNRSAQAKLQFPNRWEKWNVVARPVTGKVTQKESNVQISSRGSKRFVQIINSDFIELHLKMHITGSSGHLLADPLDLAEQSDPTRYVPILSCTRRVRGQKIDDFKVVDLRLPPRTECTLLQLGAPNPRNPFEYETEMKFGSQSNTPDKNYRWLFPCQIRQPVLCSQSFNGSITHNGKFKYSVDLACSEGTHVLCARDGIVIDFATDFSLTGVDPSFETKTNYLTVLHEDGTVSEYVHLLHNGMLVGLGEVVKRGQIIAKSGNTGWSYGPHVHFHVRQNSNKGSPTIPFRFDNDTFEGLELTTGEHYF